jgi:methionine-rich copper-binding protein CopC
MAPFLVAFAMLASMQNSGHAGMAMPAADAASKAAITRSTPADGAMLQGAPASFDVTFVRPTTLTAITLTDDTDTGVPVTAAPVQTGPATARVALPALDPGTYVLGWTGTADGRPVSGKITFMVH